MAVNNFRPRKYEDFEIVNERGLAVCSVRVKPSGILFAPAHSKMWYGVNLVEFQNFMLENGKRQEK